MMTLKYGLIPFFLIHFISITFLFLTAFVASRGTILIAFPVIVGLIACGSLCTWLAMLPGAIYGVQTIRTARRMGMIGPKTALLQFIFLLDVLDTVYLSLVTFLTARPVALYSAGFVCGVLFLLQNRLTCSRPGPFRPAHSRRRVNHNTVHSRSAAPASPSTACV